MNTKGFTLIELLVVIAIIALLAAILFPVFARAREKSFQTTCLNNQRQIATSILIYAQDNDELLPASATIWQVIGTALPVLTCPSNATKVPVNGYGYSNYCATGGVNGGPKAMGDFSHPTEFLLTADCATASGTNIITTAFDVSKRHMNDFIASFVDGHVALLTAVPTTIISIDPVAYGTFSSPYALTLSSAAFDSVNNSTPVMTLPAACKSMSLNQIGRSGYKVFNWLGAAGNEQGNGSWYTSNLSPVGMTFGINVVNSSTDWQNMWYYCSPFFDDTSLAGTSGVEIQGTTNHPSAGVTYNGWNGFAQAAGIGPNGLAQKTGAQISITVPAGDTAYHTLTVFGMAQMTSSYNRSMAVSLAPTAGFSSYAPAQFKLGDYDELSPVCQFSFTGNVTLSLTALSGDGRADTSRCFIKAIFID